MDEGWSAPDKAGVCTRQLNVGAVSTLRGKHLRRAFPAQLQSIDAWPGSWRDLLAQWISTDAERRQWRTLERLAGHARMAIAHELLSALLAGGWIEIEEKRDTGRWVTTWLRFVAPAELRRRLGLPDPDEARQAWLAESALPLDDPHLHTARASLDDLPALRALARMRLLRKLQNWGDEKRFGTRRDFALFAAGGTKAISAADWDWLAQHVDLVTRGIEPHAPVLWLRAPLTLQRGDQFLDLRLIDDCLALTARMLRGLTTIDGRITTWRLVENRTSFERVAREHGDRDGVLWLPGFPPSWWKLTVLHLLRLSPAPALIACDPDPAGIDIALQAGELWNASGLRWHPWMMDSETLETLEQRQPLSEHDRERLAALVERELPETLRDLLEWMLVHNEKGEQEGAL